MPEREKELIEQEWQRSAVDMKGELECPPAEGEDAKTEEDTTVYVVKTRRQHTEERAEYEKDDVCLLSLVQPQWILTNRTIVCLWRANPGRG